MYNIIADDMEVWEEDGAEEDLNDFHVMNESSQAMDTPNTLVLWV